MKSSPNLLPVSLSLLLALTPAALRADVPMLYGSGEIACGTTPVTLLVVPGGGAPFAEARTGDGTIVDATITLTLLDMYGDPVVGFPAEDIWLEAWGGGMAICPGGTHPDSETDFNGQTLWTRPLSAGGWTEAGLAVLVNGSIIIALEGDIQPVVLPVSINSPDINGDRAVNLSDVSLFMTDFTGSYSFRSDFYRDGSLNLLDVATLAMAWGSTCP